MSKRKNNPQSANEPKGDTMSATATGPAPAAIGQAQGETPAPAMTATPAAVDAPGQAQGETPAAQLAPIDPAKGAAPAIAPRCVDVRGLAAMLAVCPHTVMRMDDGGQLPPPLRFGATGKRGRKVYLIADIDYWLTHGRPSREKFMAMKKF